MRFAGVLAVLLCVNHLCSVAEDLSVEELAAAQQLQQTEISAIQNSIEQMEAEKRAASKAGDRDAVRRLANDLRAASKRLSATKKLSGEEFARDAARRKAEAERVRDEREAGARQAEEARKRNEERAKESGDCPLELTRVNFVHTSGQASAIVPGEFGDKTIISLDVANRSNKRVEAFEIRCVLTNGFDDVLREHKFIGAVIEPAEHKKALLTAAPQSATAVKMTVFIERVKMENGEVWQREANHRFVSMSVENLDGGVIHLPR